MDKTPPQLIYKDLVLTRDYLQEVALVLSSLQRGFLPKHPRLWQYGLEVAMRGLSTQSFTFNGEPMRAGLDLIKHKVRLGDRKWALHEFAPPEILDNIKIWVESHGVDIKLPVPHFASGIMLYDTTQAEAYAEALWWMDARFRKLKSELQEGLTSPILLYPHHFDLALAWFPYDDERQLSIGWSTGDGVVAEPYLYLSAYPELAGFQDIELPKEAYWPKQNFSGAVMPYAALRNSDNAVELFERFAGPTLIAARQLFN